MPNLQSVVVTDRAGTPVNYTLNPVSKENGVGMVAAADATGAAITEIRLSVATRRTPSRIRSTLKLRVPTVATEVVNGVNSPVVLREAFVDVTFSFDKSHSETEKNNVVGMLYSALATSKVLVNDTIVKSQLVW